MLARAYAMPAASACNRNSWSRSHTTSIWSATNPMGHTITALMPAPARPVSWSVTSGSSQGTCGGPDLDCQARSKSQYPAAAATSLVA
ncbi:Uncharacterised protein [Mycobacterium tuberculosis]|uniref:Uncharacterized protein n=1 Tax=Mycobacterium tuberculosis TaxID=1773 RepID=A0A0U0QY03_MYCTX|nr:Uncharacterised protein [Mycobacterium tuberculosis]